VRGRRRGRRKIIGEGKERRAEGTRRREWRRGEKVFLPSSAAHSLLLPLLVQRSVGVVGVDDDEACGSSMGAGR